MANALLQKLNKEMLKTHTVYENHFWTSYMGDHSVDEEKAEAQGAVDEFRANRELSAQVDTALKAATGLEREKLLQWQMFFSCYQ